MVAAKGRSRAGKAVIVYGTDLCFPPSDGPNPMNETVIIDKPMLEAFGVSDPGCVRANNEDYYLLAPNLGLYVVADGMGGARAGEHASKLAADTVWEVVQDSNSRSPETLLHAFQEANRRVFDAASTNPSVPHRNPVPSRNGAICSEISSLSRRPVCPRQPSGAERVNVSTASSLSSSE